jgi:hypothetical protein
MDQGSIDLEGMKVTAVATQAADLAESTDVPLMVLELPGGRIQAANGPLADGSYSAST